jgi:hypothetical protein
MSSDRFYVGLIKMLNQAEVELDIADLTESDRNVLLLLWESSHPNTLEVYANYESYTVLAAKMNMKISRPQFFKSLRRLVEFELIKRIGSPRSGHFQLVE